MMIIIDIPEEIYARCVEYGLRCGEAEILESAVSNGKPIQKGHGRLIDADKVIDEINAMKTQVHGETAIMSLILAKVWIRGSKTVIDAESEV